MSDSALQYNTCMVSQVNLKAGHTNQVAKWSEDTHTQACTGFTGCSRGELWLHAGKRVNARTRFFFFAARREIINPTCCWFFFFLHSKQLVNPADTVSLTYTAKNYLIRLRQKAFKRITRRPPLLTHSVRPNRHQLMWSQVNELRMKLIIDISKIRAQKGINDRFNNGVKTWIWPTFPYMCTYRIRYVFVL